MFEFIITNTTEKTKMSAEKENKKGRPAVSDEAKAKQKALLDEAKKNFAAVEKQKKELDEKYSQYQAVLRSEKISEAKELVKKWGIKSYELFPSKPAKVKAEVDKALS